MSIMLARANVGSAPPDGAAPLLNRFRGSVRKKTTTVREWYGRRFSSCVRFQGYNEPTEQPWSAQIRRFLSRTAGPVPDRYPWNSAREMDDAVPGAEPAGGVQESVWRIVGSSAAPVDDCEQPLLDGRSAERDESQRPPQSMRLPRPGQENIFETPDDLYRVRTDVAPLAELDSTAAVASGGPSLNPVYPPLSLINSAPNVFQSRNTSHTLGGQQYQAYCPPELRTNTKATTKYIIPALQAGYANGLPPDLRAAHEKETPDEEKDNQLHPTYTWPLVDFRREMFLNTDLSRPSITIRRPCDVLPVYQHPRLPSMLFSTAELEAGVPTTWGTLVEGENGEAEADGSPMSPWPSAEEVETPATLTLTLTLPSPRLASQVQYERATGQGARLVDISSLARPVSRAVSKAVSRGQAKATSSRPVSRGQPNPTPVSPAPGGELRVRYSEYNWPRFSDIQRYEDPADEHSRRYRVERRERRRRQEAGLADGE